MTLNNKKIIVVAGPTAVGKSDYAIKLAKEIDGEIISLDSVQIYKYFNIGSGKITKSEMQGIRHYMIDELEPYDEINVKKFKEMAYSHIDEIFSKGKTPILVGGTGFYIRAVLYDTDFLVEDDDEKEKIRQMLNDRIKCDGILSLYNELKEIDIASYNKIPIGNTRRIVRALEFYYMHNMPISKHNEIELNKESKFDFTFYVLTCNREHLYTKINNRVDKMIKNGLLDEIKYLISIGVTNKASAMNSIGYKELYDYCCKNKNDDSELNKCIDLIKMHSRNYAKRQMTWFKSQKNILMINNE